MRGLDAFAARALGLQPGGALLVRPDAAPAGWWPGGTDAASAVRSAVASARAGGRHLNGAATATDRDVA